MTTSSPRPSAPETVLVTGHCGAIGSAITRELTAEGFRVLGMDIEQLSSNDVLEPEQQLMIDLGSMEHQDPRVNDFLNRELEGESLVGLINCSACQITAEALDVDRKAFITSMTVNALAPLLLTQCCAPWLESNNGMVINIGSIHAALTKQNFLPYAVSKAALAGVTRSLALELGTSIRVVEIQPAAIETAMLEAGFEGNPSGRAQLDQMHPTKRIGQPQDVAQACLMLLKFPAQFLNGAVLNLDGGISFALKDPE